MTAQANHLFGNATGGAELVNATVFEATEPGSNATKHGSPSAATSVDGIGGWTASTDDNLQELRLLVTAFSPKHKTSDGDPVQVSVSFKRPEYWMPTDTKTPVRRLESSTTTTRLPVDDIIRTQPPLQIRTATLDRSNSPFDSIWRDGYANGWLTNASDPNVYPLSLSIRTMLTKAGKYALVQEKGPDYLEMQRRTPHDGTVRPSRLTCKCAIQPCTVGNGRVQP